MPQPFNNAVMTNAGARLLTRAQAGEVKIQFTRIATGNGTYSAAEKTLAALQARAALKSQKNSYPLSDIDVFSDYSVKVTALITNLDPVTREILVKQGYYINEMGLYAKPAGEPDSAEVLYSITVTAGENGDFMPPYNGYNPAQIVQDYFATVDNSAEVTINSAGAALLAEDANKLRDDTTKQKYKIGIDNGLIYIQEVDE
ncbi:MAG: phage tail protein [Roseburia sp.]|nr:phage tail protein [Roseburia sp.]MCM1097747.1 phage tail protein [Ruminococcus flavefaciens]